MQKLSLAAHLENRITMYAIVDIAGQQFKVEAGKEIFVHRLEGKEGDKVEFEKILLTDNKGKIAVGDPFVKGKVSASIVEHMKGDKVLVFKKKRRKGYRKLNGHRQYLTKIKIDTIK
jgi:large subunit ribosomal protein L21